MTDFSNYESVSQTPAEGMYLESAFDGRYSVILMEGMQGIGNAVITASTIEEFNQKCKQVSEEIHKRRADTNEYILLGEV